jgi:hypothetical protein
VFSFSVVVLGCDSPETTSPQKIVNANAPSEDSEDTDGDPGPGAAEGDEYGLEPVDPVDRPESQTDEQPCGENTVAQVTTETGSVVTFCIVGDRAGILESAHMGVASAGDPTQYACALDLFLDIAPPDAEIPEELIAFCAESDGAGRPLPDGGGVHASVNALPLTDSAHPFLNHYCAASTGASAWITERCNTVDGGLNCDAYRCQQNLVSSHQLTCSSQLADQCNWSQEAIGSCTESTLLRSWSNGGFSGPPDASATVLAGSWNSSHWECQFVGCDLNTRYRGDPFNAGAVHRYANCMIDDW